MLCIFFDLFEYAKTKYVTALLKCKYRNQLYSVGLTLGSHDKKHDGYDLDKIMTTEMPLAYPLSLPHPFHSLSPVDQSLCKAREKAE